MKIREKSTIQKALVNGMICCLLVVVTLFAMIQTMHMQAAAASVQTVNVGIPVEEHPELFLTRSMPTHGEGKIAVFLIDFPDYRNDNPMATKEYYDKLYFSGGLDLPFDFDVGTVANFYKIQSYGKLNLSGQVFDWYTAKHERSYYDNKTNELIIEAAEYYISKGVDFSKFDGNKDGVIDAITFHFTGDYSTMTDTPWYSGVCMSNSAGWGKIGGLQFKTIVQIAEKANYDNEILSTICHELLHTLGMYDIYTKYSYVLVTLDLMAGWSYNTINPYYKLLLGWIDKVQVVTQNTDNITVKPYGETGTDIVIVTNKFTGFFDEFFIVAYRANEFFAYSGNTPAIWHIDARVTEDGNSFKNNNLNYLPVANTHFDTGTSAHPFIEELSADPKINFWLDMSINPAMVEFKQNSVLGPNSLPSSDTHDGKYTGIQIDNFIEHNEEYLTFDVSFVEDKTAPTVAKNEDDLQIAKIVKVDFNEFIYAGTSFGNIKVTDLKGKSLDVTIALTNEPHHRMEITFNDESYNKGYIIVIPEDGIRDSSGNAIKAISLTSPIDKYLFPIDKTQLHATENYAKISMHSFEDKDGITIISGIAIKHKGEWLSGAKLEILRLNYKGKIIFRKIIDNPFYSSDMDIETGSELIPVYVCKTDDNCYIIGHTLYGICDRMFCIDSDGNVKWTNDRYYKTGSYFYIENALAWNNGIVAHFNSVDQMSQTVHISSETGAMQAIENISVRHYKLSNGKLLYLMAQNPLQMQIIDPISFNIELMCELQLKELEDSRDFWVIEDVQSNNDGTIMLFARTINEKKEVFLLDANLQLINSVPLDQVTFDGYYDWQWVNNDGFVYLTKTDAGDVHAGNKFFVCRYDRYLNLIWQANINADSIDYHISESGEVFAYVTRFYESNDETSLCYIEYYGNENNRKTKHIHNLVHTKAVLATCITEGTREYWHCTSCGCYYSDQGKTLITDMKEISTPVLDHSPEVISGYAATCQQTGLTDGSRCSICFTILTEQEVIPATGAHAYVPTVVEPQFGVQGYTLYTCSACGHSYKDNYTDPLPYLLGDIDLDGDIDASDLTLLARHSAKIELITDPGALTTADINQDGEVTASDLTKLARHVAKIELIVQN